MSCLNNCYLPQPPRAWSRVQNSCSLTTNTDNNTLVKDPYTGQLVTSLVLAQRVAMLNKGNVLQYKIHSSNLTKAQRYSKIAKGQWINRNTTWATQSTSGYTNPNTTSLKRSGNVVNIAIDPITGAVIGPTTAPVTCPKPVTPVNPALPSNGGGGSDIDDPDIPPPINPTPGSNVFPNIIPTVPIVPIVIQDGGTLICSEQENICTGETRRSLSQQLCNPTTDSDVPGTIQELCWNDGTPTWYPRQRYVMTNSTNKWPVNAELFSSIQINPPYITSITSNSNIVTLTWNKNDSCLPASQFEIYQDGILIKTVPRTIFTTEIIVSNCNSYQYYIIATNITAKSRSDPSNLVGITISYIEPITNLNYTTIGDGSIQLFWNASNNYCGTVSYNVYQDNTKNTTTTNTNIIISSLTNCQNYTFSVSSIDSNGNESSKQAINVLVTYINPPTNLNYTTVNNGTIQLSWTPTDTYCGTVSYNVYQDSTKITNPSTPDTIITIPNLINCQNYTFSVSSVDSYGNESSQTTLNDVIILWTNPPTFVSAVLDQTTPNIFYNVIVSWTNPSQCLLGTTTFNIYVNDILFGTTPSSLYTYTITTLIPNTYGITVTTVINDNESAFSNQSNVTVYPIYNTTNGTPYVSGDDTNTTLLLFTDTTNQGTLVFNYTTTDINFLIIAGGGGGGAMSTSNNYPGGGGGGGGYLYTDNTGSPIMPFTSSPNTQINITVGSGGKGAYGSIDPLILTNNGENGSNTIITPINTNTYAASYGVGSDGANGSYGSTNPYGSGTGYSGGYLTNSSLATNSCRPGNFGYGGGGGSGDTLDNLNEQNGDSSTSITYTLPFTIEDSSVIFISGGGGSGSDIGYGGACGNGSGGDSGVSSVPSGFSALNSLPSFGGGGGGCATTIASLVNTGGNGGQGMALFWWTT